MENTNPNGSPEDYEVPAEKDFQTPTGLPSTDTPVPVSAAPRTKRSKNKTTANKKTGPARPVEEIYTLDPKKMTDVEKNNVIKFFQDNMQELYDQFESYKQNTEGAFEQARVLRKQNERIKREATAKIGLLKQNLSTAYQNALLIKMED